MKKLLNLFKIKRGEWLPTCLALIVSICLNALCIQHYYDQFSKSGRGYWNIFIDNFHVSGFDCITYSVISHWDPVYDITRHPLLAYIMYPLWVIDDWVMFNWQYNPVQLLIVPLLVVCAVYAFIFTYRTLREIIELKQIDAWILSTMLFSFGMIMTAIIVPDHFCLSLFLLMLTIYLSGKKIKENKEFTIWQTVVLFIATAGITLSNGIKVFLSALFVNKLHIFRPKYLILAILIPAAAIWGFGQWEYDTYKAPKIAETKAKAKQQRQKDIDSVRMAYLDTTSIKDSAAIEQAVKYIYQKKVHEEWLRNMKDPWNAHQGKPIEKTGFLKWTDMTTSRWLTIKDNLFGESIQLHQDHLLEDVLQARPVFVSYRWIINDIVELVIAGLMLAGIWFGRKERLLWMVLSWFAFDMTLHLGLGFGINEVYIMGAHWLFIIPISMAYLLKACHGKSLIAMRVLTAALTIWLWAYNGSLLWLYLK